MTGKSLPTRRNNSMRICVLIDAWYPIWGGGQVNVWEISRRIAKQHALQIDIFTRSLTDATKILPVSVYESSPFIKVIRVGPKSKFFTIWARCLWLLTVIGSVLKQHRQQNYSLIHAHAYSAAIPAKILGKLLNIPVIFTVHGSNHLDSNTATLAAYLENFLLTKIKFTRMISVSKHFLKYPNSNKQIVIIPNGVDVQLFDRVHVKKINDSIFNMLWVGRFDAVKGIEYILQALVLSVKKDKNIRLNLVGYGYEEKQIRQLVHTLQLEKYVKFSGPRFQRTLVKMYKAADIFILSSLSEGQPLTILEAMAAHLAVIATDVGDNAHFVKNNGTGYLIPPANVSALAKAIDMARYNSNLVKMGKQGYRLVKKKYSWNLIARQTSDVYKKLVPSELW